MSISSRLSFVRPKTRSLILAGTAVISALALSSCGLATIGSDGSGTTGSTADETRTISMIVTETPPFQEPTEIAREKLAEAGWTLETTYVTDIIQPNEVVNNGEYDVNFFQHHAYMRQFNRDNGTQIEPLFSVYYGGSGFFSERYDSLEELPDGAQVALPVDRSNNGRALKILADEGIIEVDESKEITELSQQDITANPKNLQFIEVNQQSLGQTLPDVDAGYGFTSPIAEAGFDIEETLIAAESDPDAVEIFTVVVAAKDEFRGSEAAQALQDAYQSPEVKDWFDNYLGGGTDFFSDDVTLENSDQLWEELNA